MKDIIPVGCWNNKYYLWTDEHIECCKCSKDLKKTFVLNTFRKPLIKILVQRCYCLNCFEQVKRELYGTLSLIIIDFPIPPDCIPIIPDTLLVKQVQNAHNLGGIFPDDEDLHERGVQLINHCKWAFNPDQSKQAIPANYVEQIESRIKELDVPIMKDEDAFDDLDTLSAAEPFKEVEDDKKLISENECGGNKDEIQALPKFKP